MKKILVFTALAALAAASAFAETRGIRPQADGEGFVGSAAYRWGTMNVKTATVESITASATPLVYASEIDQPNGVAGLDANGYISATNIPSITVSFTGGERTP